MGCQICSRDAASQTSFYCPSCARSQLYVLRYENARVLLEKESIGQEIEVSIVGNNNNQNTGRVPQQAAHERGLRWTIQAIQTEQARTAGRVRSMRTHAETLKNEIQRKKAEVETIKARLKQRRSDAESAKYQLEDRRHLALSNIQNSIKRTEHLWHSLHTKTAESRIFLCREAANLYRLRQKARRKNNSIVESYWIGGVQVVDLKELHGAMPSHISTSFSNIAHLLVLVSHYLSLRLPAEIVLPHRNHATPTIYSPAASYSTRGQTMESEYKSWYPSNSPTATTTTTTTTVPPGRAHRPRPLSVDKSLSRLMKEEPSTYALFIEGAALLAWNVSWLCRTQGLHIGSDNWEAFSNMGKNLWQLLVSPPNQNHPSTIRAVSNGHDVHSKLKIDNKNKTPPKTTIQRTKSFPIFGHYSHGTSHSFLGAAEGMEFVKSWKLMSPTKLADQLKAALQGEMANAEWELLEEREWDEGLEFDLPAPTTTTTTTTATTESEVATTTTNTSTEQSASEPSENPSTDAIPSNEGSPETENNKGNTDVESKQRNPNRPRGTSGWTKLKTR